MKSVEGLLNCLLTGSEPHSVTYESRMRNQVLVHYTIAEMAKAMEKQEVTKTADMYAISNIYAIPNIYAIFLSALCPQHIGSEIEFD